MCDSTFKDVGVLKSHYQFYHFINEKNYFYREIFSLDNTSKRYDECKTEFKSYRLKKKSQFFVFIIIKLEVAGTSNYQLMSLNTAQ